MYEGKIDDQTAIDEVESMLIGGSETSSGTASFIILLLAMHPEVQDRVYQELCTVYMTQDENTTHEQLQQLSYLDRVIREGT